MLEPTPRATKIVATLGPASSDPAVLERMLRAGVNVVRVNFSHGTADEHTATVERVREIADRIGQSVGVLADLQGPKIRIGKFAEGKVTLAVGDRSASSSTAAGRRDGVGLTTPSWSTT